MIEKNRDNTFHKSQRNMAGEIGVRLARWPYLGAHVSETARGENKQKTGTRRKRPSLRP